jgi:hypothetical protein
MRSFAFWAIVYFGHAFLNIFVAQKMGYFLSERVTDVGIIFD